MVARMARSTSEERCRWAEAAQIARRGSTDRLNTLTLRAMSKGLSLQYVAMGEIPLASMLSTRGWFADMQCAAGQYNIDLAFGRTAVEVHRQCRHPYAYERLEKRTVDLIEHGWTVLYVWIKVVTEPYRAEPLTDRCADTVADLLANPSQIGRRHVIRANGDRQD